MNNLQLNTDNYLEFHLLDEEISPLMIVAPGGGYEYTSSREALPIVNFFKKNGFHTHIVYYRETKLMYQDSFKELAEFVRTARENALALHIDPNKIYLIGFSSGGHFVASLGVEYQKYDDLSKPNAMVLAYPVITGKKGIAHDGSIQRLYGEINEQTRHAFSLEDKVSINTAPTFIFHTVEDTAVPYQNSLLFFQALNAFNVGAELHLYQKGPHGLSLANRNTPYANCDPLVFETKFLHQASWIDLALSWLKTL